MQTKLSIFCDKVIEAGWLVAPIVAPLFFNMYSHRAFEPDKLYLLQSIALLIVVTWIIRFMDSHDIWNKLWVQRIIRPNFKKWIFDIPLVLPALLLAGIYLISTLLSVTPKISLWGSYTRLQGTFTMFAYLVIFFSILGMTRRWEQVHLLWVILILTSLPISFYGILQHFHSDPIPWGGERAGSVPSRIVSTMGNPIFFGAYLIMVVPVTLARIVETISVLLDQRRRTISSVVLIFFYVSMMGLQLLCLLFTQSRGPWLGLMGGLYLFIFLALLSLRRKNENQGCLNLNEILKALVFTIVSIPVGVIPAYLFFIILKRGFRWLWVSWLFHTFLIGGILVLLVLPHTPLSSPQKIPYLDRLISISHTDTGSVKVRMLIWKGTNELLKADLLRTIIGYGPESIQTIYPRYYPPELAQHAYRSSPVDRSHNETFDVLVTTGLFGLGVYILFIGSIFYWALKWLGFLVTKRDHLLLRLFMTIGGITGVLLPKWIEGTYRLLGVGIPLGLIFGALFYLIISGMTSPHKTVDLKKPWLFIGLFSALVAHLIEIQFGITVAVTRLYFWIYLGLFVLMGLNWIGSPPEIKKTETPTSLEHSPPQRFTGILAGSFLMATILFTLGLMFINNPKLEMSWIKVIQISLTTLGLPGSFKPSYGALYMFLLTWVIGGFIVVFENEHQSFSNKRKERWTFGPGIYIYVTLLVFFISIIIHARNIRPPFDPSNTITFYYLGVFILIFLIAWAFFQNLPLPKRLCRKSMGWAYPIFIFLAVFIIFHTHIIPIKADIYFKQGEILKEEKQIDRSIQFNRLAITLAPGQDNYHAELSRTLMIKEESMSDPKAKNLIFEECFKSLDQARQINPLNSQHYPLLGYLFHAWGKIDSSPEGRKEKLNQSHFYYKQAVHYAPHDILTYHLWVQVFLTQGDFDGALDKLNISLSLNPRFGPTYFNLGEIYSAQGKLEEAKKSYWQALTYEPNLAKAHIALGFLAFKDKNFSDAKDFLLEALRLDPNQPTIRSVLGIIYFKSGQMEQAIEENLEVLRLLPDDLSSLNNLALIYKKIGRFKEALIHAQKALELSPEKDKPGIQRFIDQLKAKSPADKKK